jgi:mRNA interferase HicA
MTSSEMKRWLAKLGAQFGEQKGSHLKVHLHGRSTVLPMHPSKELATGTVNAIKRQLGLK